MSSSRDNSCSKEVDYHIQAFFHDVALHAFIILPNQQQQQSRTWVQEQLRRAKQHITSELNQASQPCTILYQQLPYEKKGHLNTGSKES